MKNLKVIYGMVSFLFLTAMAVACIPVDIMPQVADSLHISVDTLTHYAKWFGGTSGLSLAMGYYPSCAEAQPQHNCDPCEEREFGRIRSAGFIHKSFEFADGDTTNASEWQRGIEEGKIYVIPETNGELPEPSEITGTGYGETVETVLGYDFAPKFVDPNYASNVDFYNALIGNRNYKFFYRTSSKVHITQKTVTIIPKTNIANDLNSEVVWGTVVKWRHNQFPIPFDTPEGIFDSCYIPGE
jgi:hypothetical protein